MGIGAITVSASVPAPTRSSRARWSLPARPGFRGWHREGERAGADIVAEEARLGPEGDGGRGQQSGP
jgi:hypothetical protein